MWNATLIVEVGETKSLVHILNKGKKYDYLTAIKLPTGHNRYMLMPKMTLAAISYSVAS